MSTVEQAEALLGAREVERALAVYKDVAGTGIAESDRIDGGRWMCHMLLGEFERAWRCSDAIRARSGADPYRFWMGEPIDGKRLMLRCLHGYGDTVMYLRWLPELRKRCSEVTIQASPEMLPLLEAIAAGSRAQPDFSRAGNAAGSAIAPVQVITWAPEGESDRALWDVQVECAELPYLFRTAMATLPPPTSMVFPEALAHRFRMRLGQRTKPRVGLVWTGSSYDPARSVPFAQFSRLLENRTLEFWSLQSPENNGVWSQWCSERGWVARTFYTRSLDSNEFEHAGIADMAAFAQEMDVVITIDTMAAHVAGSLCLPTWLLLKREADWRWMLEREDSPWYPTMRLFRQTAENDWDEPLTLVLEALRDFEEELQA